MTDPKKSGWILIYKSGGIAALLAVAFAVLEIGITFLPGGAEVQETVVDYFLFFQQHPLLAMRNLGLVNIGINTMLVAAFFAIYGAHRKGAYEPLAALSMIIGFIGLAVFFATNRAFPMLVLSRQYAVAASDAQRTLLEAAGHAMLVVGASHTPGTFPAFFSMEIAGMLISIVMLRAKIFNRTGAFAGIIGFSLLLAFEIISSFVAGVNIATTFLAMVGGIASMVWYGMTARRLFQLSEEKDDEV